MKRNTFYLTLFAICGLVMGMTLASCSKDDDNNVTTPTTDWSQKQAKYTIMFYGCGGGNLDEWYEDAISSIVEKLNVNNNEVRFAVMFNTSKDASEYIKEGYTPNITSEWATAYRYELTPQATNMTVEEFRSKFKYKAASEVPLYKTATLVEYINWVKQNVPAENYIFMPMNHGGGLDLSEEETRAIGYDDNHMKSNNKNMYAIGERAIVDALRQTNTHLKAIYWCGCMMGQLEVMTQVAPYCDYQFCSSHVSRSIPGLIYDIVTAINSDPDDFVKVAQADQKLKDQYYNSCFINVDDPNHPGKKHNENCDWGCWRSDRLAAINAQVKKLATLVSESYGIPEKRQQINAATASTYVLEYDSHFADVLDFAVNVAEHLDGGQNATAKQIVTDLESTISAANVYRINGVNIVNSMGQTIAPKKGFFSLGISIYANDNETWEDFGDNYKATDFDKATGWSAFLDQNTVGVFKSAINPANNSVWNLDYLDE